MTEVSKSFFVDQLVGNRNTIRLVETSCGWAMEMMGKKTLEIFHITVHLDAFEQCLKELDQVIYIPKTFIAVEGIQKAYDVLQKKWFRISDNGPSNCYFKIDF